MEELQKGYKKQTKEILQGSALDLNGLNSYAAVLGKHISEIDKKSLLLSEKQVEYERLVRELKQQEKNYLLYLNKTEEARIEEQQDSSRASNVIVSSWGKVPSVPVFPKKLLMSFLSLVIGSLVGIAGAFTAYYMDHTVKTPEDISRTCRSQVLTFIADQTQVIAGGGSIPTPGGKSPTGIFSQSPLESGHTSRPDGGGVPLWMAEPQRYPGILESFRPLKAHLQFLAKSHPPMVIQLTGANQLCRRQHHGQQSGPGAGLGPGRPPHPAGGRQPGQPIGSSDLWLVAGTGLAQLLDRGDGPTAGGATDYTPEPGGDRHRQARHPDFITL